jgi:hypothetical protein
MTQLGIPPTPRVSIPADTYLDAFRFSDESVYEALGLYRTEVESGS